MLSTILFILYVLVGPLAWLALILGFYLGRSRMDRLIAKPLSLPENAPAVTIVIPAKDEAARIGECVHSVLQQNYPHFTVLIVDDRSTDGTGKILDDLASQHAANSRFASHLAITHIENLPAGWLGKCHALHAGTRAVTSPWLLFVDSDVTLQPGALRDAISLALSREYDAISLLTRVDGRSFWECLMIPISAATWAVMFMISLTNNDRYPHIAAANGQFFLIRKDAYDAVGGHDAVKAEIVEDVELMRLLKSRGYTCRLLIGSHLASTRMHQNLRELRSGWGRIYAGTNRFKPGKLIAAMLFIVFCGFSVYPAIFWGFDSHDKGWLIASLGHLAAITAYLSLIYRATFVRVFYALLFPLSGVVLLNLLAVGIRRCRHRHFEWRGTKFTAERAAVPSPPGRGLG